MAKVRTHSPAGERQFSHRPATAISLRSTVGRCTSIICTGKLFERGAGVSPDASVQAPRQGEMQAIGQEGNEDVRLDDHHGGSAPRHSQPINIAACSLFAPFLTGAVVEPPTSERGTSAECDKFADCQRAIHWRHAAIGARVDPLHWDKAGRLLNRRGDLQADIAADLIRRGLDVHAFNQRSVAGATSMTVIVSSTSGAA
jgi:hypothetical protein